LTFKIHLAQVFLPTQVQASLTASTQRTPPAVERVIENAWQEARARLGDRLFDGPMMRLESWHINDGRLHLEFSPTSYKPFLGTNLTHPELAEKYGNNCLANPLGLSAALQSADGYLLFGRRNGSVAYHPNRIHPFAGSAVDLDVFAEIRRELAEELALKSEDIADIRCIGMAEDCAIRQPELIFSVISKRTKAQIEQSLDRAEHTELIAVKPDSQSIASADWTPIAEATLQLWRHVKSACAN
jgi:hypothetical protein